jgi:hypothetical protein
MKGLTTELLGKACRVFLTLAYPEGEASIALPRRPFSAISPEQPLTVFLEMTAICEKLFDHEGRVRGYAFRLGSARFPHLKLQVSGLENGETCVFSVDTHDGLKCGVPPTEKDAWARIQAENRRLKMVIEQEWERQGLLTFNGILRRGLSQK